MSDDHDDRAPEPEAPKASPKEMRLRPDRPPVTRLSRKAILGFGAITAVGIAGAVFVALNHHHETAVPDVHNTANRTAPEGLTKLPRDYAGLQRSAPKLGPPLPGDLGKPMLNAGVSAPGMPVPDAATPEGQRLRQERDAARTSKLFTVTAQTAASAPSPASSAVSAAPPNAGGPLEQSISDHKLAFLNGATNRQTQSRERLVGATSPYTLQAGAVIAAALITGLRSDLPGLITAQVTENAYDSVTGKILLIPQGARLIGQYDAQISFGQSRALLVWNRLIMPNGRSIVLYRQPGVDVSGYAGLEDDVDHHWGTLFEAAALSTILSIGTETGASNNENNLAQAIRQGASQSISQAGEQVVGRALNVQPTITIRPGFPVRVLVTRDLVLEPYHARADEWPH